MIKGIIIFIFGLIEFLLRLIPIILSLALYVIYLPIWGAHNLTNLAWLKAQKKWIDTHGKRYYFLATTLYWGMLFINNLVILIKALIHFLLPNSKPPINRKFNFNYKTNLN